MKQPRWVAVAAQQASCNAAVVKISSAPPRQARGIEIQFLELVTANFANTTALRTTRTHPFSLPIDFNRIVHGKATTKYTLEKMENKSKTKNSDFDLQKQWTGVLRAATKNVYSPSCWICDDQRPFASEAEIRNHFQETHPSMCEGEAAKAFEAKLRGQQQSSSETKSSKPLFTPTSGNTNRRPKSRSGARSPRPSRLQGNAPVLTERVLLQHSHETPPKKKVALGNGSSPTSSARTNSHRGGSDVGSRSQFSQLSPLKAVVPPPDSWERRLISGQVRGPTKRLFEPSTDSPFIAKNPSSPTTPQPHNSQARYYNHNLSQSSTGKQYGQSKPIPISILSVPPHLQQEQSQQEEPSPPDPEQIKLVRQPETRPISQEQLVAEVKGIYAGLVMVEGKCIQVDQKQAALAREARPGAQLKLTNEQWQALIALHRTLLHEHHDFFLASQHPSATPAVRRLAIKYAMPARLWRHGIHSFLELLRNRLPDSLDHMLAFIYLAYSMMTLLYETVPAFEDTWIECLGDLGRYRMAIEDDDIRDREVWTQVARQWYLKASDKQPATGRLYHHLAILARPNALQQLFFYSKALSVSQPFIAARESVLTLFEPVLNQKQTRRFPPVVTAFVKVNAIIFLHNNQEEFSSNCNEFLSLLDSYIARTTQRFLEHGYYIAISNIIALLGFGSTDSILVKALSSTPTVSDVTMGGTSEELLNILDPLMFKESQQLFNQTADIVLQRIGDPNVLSFLHVLMVFMEYMSKFSSAMMLLADGFPMENLVVMLNTLIRFYQTYDRIEQEARPVPDKNDFRPVPEEFAMRGLFWALEYYPPGWFLNNNIEDENQYKEEPMNSEYRPELILWLAVRFARAGDWISYDQQEKKFLIPSPASIQSPEKDFGSRSTTATATAVGDQDQDQDEEMSIASQTSSRKSTFELGITDTDSVWDIMTTRSETESQETSRNERMDVEHSSLASNTKVERLGDFK